MIQSEICEKVWEKKLKQEEEESNKRMNLVQNKLAKIEKISRKKNRFCKSNQMSLYRK